MLAARSVDVPSMDELLSQRSRLWAQLWREDQREIQAFLRGLIRDDADGWTDTDDFQVERLFRDTRVDRIWEGTSEMMRSIILNGVMKRELDELLS